jgi:hypothetical protein
MGELSADEQMCESAREALFSAIDDEEMGAERAGPDVSLADIWRTIMKSPITKLAVAAVIIIAVLLAIKVFIRPAEDPGREIAKDSNGRDVPGGEGGIQLAGYELEEKLREEAEQIEKMYAAGDVDGLAAMLSEGQFESKLLAAKYLAEIGDERALPMLRTVLLSEENLPEDNAFAEAIEAIEARTSDANGAGPEVVAGEANAVGPNEGAVEQVAGDLLELVPAKSLFCVFVNNFDYTLGMVDQFLAGLSPVPAGATMGARMQLAGFLGDPAFSGVNTTGNFAVFGVVSGDEFESGAMENMFMGLLVPVPDFAAFVSGNANCGKARWVVMCWSA